MELSELIRHPEQLDRDTLYELRSMLALYPYFQTARLLLLQNLYLLHDPSFNDELRRAAIYITDRKVIFQMVEAGHYQLKAMRKEQSQPLTRDQQDSRTLSLIDNFLESLPKDDVSKEQKQLRKPTPADAAVDYVAYLMESGFAEEQEQEAPQLIGQSLIDTFIANDRGKRVLNENPTLRPEIETDDDVSAAGQDYTDTLARIYIKQRNYEKALHIIINLNSSQEKKRSPFYEDQIRFLQKLIINNNQTNKIN